MNNTLPSKYQGRSLEDLRSSLRAVNRKIDSMKIEAAQMVGVLPLKPGRRFWVATEIDWNDTRLDHLRPKYFSLLDAAYELEHIVGRLEAEKNNTVKEYEASQKVYQFLHENFDNFDEEVAFFKKNGLIQGTISLRDRLVKNPDYLDEVIL